MHRYIFYFIRTLLKFAAFYFYLNNTFQFVIYEKFCSYRKLLLSESLIVLVQLPFVTNPFYPSTSLIRKEI